MLLLADAADRRELSSQATLDVQVVNTPDQLLATIEAMPWPAGEGFVWCAGEASVMAGLRTVLLEQKSHPREAMRVAAYWKRGATEFHENLES